VLLDFGYDAGAAGGGVGDVDGARGVFYYCGGDGGEGTFEGFYVVCGGGGEAEGVGCAGDAEVCNYVSYKVLR
jgi:hypothetical protein